MRGFERRVSLGFIVACAAIFVVALLLVPPFGVTFDEAKYLGIGFSMIEGRGPQIVFGGYFFPHAPLWPTVVVAPAVALGIDPLGVGRFLNALSGLGLILLSAALAWRVRPAAAALAAIGLLATTVLHELTRTARLDVPSATLAVAYLALGLVAVRRGSARYAVAAGVLFGIAFLVKEVVLPLAPVPILAAMLHRQPWRPIARTAGWLTLSSTVVVAPWFIFVADVGNRVYRLGTPLLDAAGRSASRCLALGVAGIVAGREARPEAVADRRRPRPRAGTHGPAGRPPPHVAGGRPHDRLGDRPDAGLHGHPRDARDRPLRPRPDQRVGPPVVSVPDHERGRRHRCRAVDPVVADRRTTPARGSRGPVARDDLRVPVGRSSSWAWGRGRATSSPRSPSGPASRAPAGCGCSRPRSAAGRR